jgi:hypothetical protein
MSTTIDRATARPHDDGWPWDLVGMGDGWPWD